MKSFTECNGLEIVEGDVDHLAISEEVSDDGSFKYPVLIFTPHMSMPTNYFQIELFAEEAEKLYAWLGKHLEKT